MEIEKRVEGLEGEFRLIKGEVKQSLTDIRDYVLEGKPVPQSAPLEESLQEVPPVKQMDSHSGDASESSEEQPEYERLEEIVDEELLEAGNEAPFDQQPPFQEEPLQEELFPEETDSLLPEASMPFENQAEPELLEDKIDEKPPEAGKEEKMVEKASGPMLQANQLPNLIRWVSIAKREIGAAQLPTFLEAYGVRGHLSSEMKEIILHLAAVVSEQSADVSSADVWSRLTLELHGILTDSSG